MKKGFILFTALFLISTFTAFAAVKAVKEGDVVKVTWTYENADAASVGLVGDFQGWNLAGALPMTKDANGVWTITLDGKADSEYTYKFNVDGEWTEDPTAPFTADDGFGGMNGKAVVAELLTAVPGAAVAPAARGLTVGYFQATWLRAGFATENPNDTAKKGFSADQLSLHNKAYYKFDGYLFKDLLYTAGEIKLFDGAVDIWKKTASLDAATGLYAAKETVTFADGAENLASLPWTLIQSFGMSWADTKGKFKAVLELQDLNLKVAHSVGWSKTVKQNIAAVGFIEAWSEPDAANGVTEIYPIAPVDLGGAKMDYLVNFDKSQGKYSNLAYTTVTLDNLLIEAFANINSNTDDIGYYAKAITTRDILGVKYTMDAMTFKAQGGIYTNGAEGATVKDGYFAAASAAYDVKDMMNASVEFKYAGQDANTGLIDGDNGFDGKFKNTISLSYFVAPTLKVYVENGFAANYSDFKGMTDYVKAGVNFKDGIDLTPEVKVSLPLEDGAKFGVDYVQVTAITGGLNAQLRYMPTNEFKDTEVRIRTVYDLGDGMGVVGAVAAKLDSDDTNNVFGLTAGFNMKTPFENVKSPYLFVTADYNMNPMDGDDNYVLKDIDNGDFSVKSGAALRAGLRWNF